MSPNREATSPELLRLERVAAPVSLKDQAYLAIKRAILSLRLKPGEALVESDLAAQLGISKTPVRTALHELEREGLVTKILYKGTYVSEITLRDVREIFQLRAVLEGLAARLATPAFNDSESAQAKELVRLMEVAIQNEDQDLASLYGKRFHDLILEKADNQHLQLLVHNLDDQVQRFRLISDQISGRLQRSLAEHKGILGALEQRNPDLAEQRVKEHLHSVIEELSSAEGLDAGDAGEEKVS